jgi:hypothetical protein
MSTWSWAAVGVAGFLLSSIVFGLGVAAILGRIGREISELLESDLLESDTWSSAANARERREAEQDMPSEKAGRAERVRMKENVG